MASYDQFSYAMRSRIPGLDEEEIRRQWERINKPRPTLGEEAKAGAMSGLAQVGLGLGGMMQFVGAEDLGGEIAQGARRILQDYPDPRAGMSVLEQPGAVLGDPGYWVRGVLEQGPNLAVSAMMPGGALAKGLTAGVLETAPEFSAALDEGMGPIESRLRAVGGTLGIGALNAIPFAQAFSKTASPAARIGGTALTEGLTEWAEEPLQALTWGHDPYQALIQGANVAPIAALTGGLMGGGAEAYNRLASPGLAENQQTDTDRMREELNQLRQEIPQVWAATLYHGSPEKFDRLALGVSGNGAGGDEFGSGLYLAEDPAVAGAYQAAARPKNATVKPEGDAFRALYTDRAGRKVDLGLFETKDVANEAISSAGGYLYKVDVKDAVIERMLDWDAPISQQQENVKTAIKRLWNRVYDEPFNENSTGREFYDDLTQVKNGSKADASQALRRAGIPGIKYLDQGSRTSGKGTRNIVLFDENLANIESRNGEPVDPQVWRAEIKRYRAGAEGAGTGGAFGRRIGTTGQYVGAPKGIDNPQKLAALHRRLLSMAKRGEPGRYWYERSSEEILDTVGGDVVEAEKLVQAIAITSSTTPVKANLDYALQAYLQHKNLGHIKTGKYPKKMSRALERTFNGIPWGGRKTNNFYVNLMRRIDPSYVQGVTNDVWMMRAFGYDTDSPTDAQYDFAERMAKRVMDSLNRNVPQGQPKWEPQQVQAAIWTAAKADKQGTDILTASKDYKDFMEDTLAQISWESKPGDNTSHMQEMFQAPIQQQVEYHRAVSTAFLDENGVDIIARELGLPSPGDFEAPGYYEGEVSPGTQTEATAPRAYKGPAVGQIEPAAFDLMNLYAAIRGIALHQKGMAWHRPFFKENLSRNKANGVEVRIGRPLTFREIAELGRLVEEVAGHGEYAPVSTRTGVRFLNFDYLGLENKAFHAIINEALERMTFEKGEQVDAGLFAFQGNYIENDWRKFPDGEGYLAAVTSGRPGLRRKAHRVLAKVVPQVQQIDQEFSERYGWKQNPAFQEQTWVDDTQVWKGEADNASVPTEEFPRAITFQVGSGSLAQDTVVRMSAINTAQLMAMQRSGLNAVAPVQGSSLQTVASILGDVINAGVPAQLLDNIGGIFSFGKTGGTYAAYAFSNQSGPMLGFDRDALTYLSQHPQDLKAQEMYRVGVIHETGHAADFSMSPTGNASISWYHPEFALDPIETEYVQGYYEDGSGHIQLKGGGIIQEAIDYFETHDHAENSLARMLAYPLADMPAVAGSGVTIQTAQGPITIGKGMSQSDRDMMTRRSLKEVRRIQGEVFAQLWAAYHTNPALMQKELPRAHAFIKKYREAIDEGVTFDGSRERVQQDFWAPHTQRGATVFRGERGAPTGSLAERARVWRADSRIPGPGGDRRTQREGPPFLSAGQRERLGNLSPQGVVGVSLDPMERKLVLIQSKIFGKERRVASRGTISLPEMDNMADALGMHPEELARRTIGSAWNAEHIRAGAKLVRDRTRLLKEKSLAAVGGGVKEKTEFMEAYYSLAEVLVPFQGVAAEAGRALGAFRGATRGMNPKELADILEDPRMDITERAAKIATLEGGGVANYVGREMTPTWGDKLLELWINSLLSGPQTQAVNLFSNGLVDIFSVAEHLVASGISQARGDKAIPLTAVLDRTHGMLTAGRQALSSAKTVFSTEVEFGENKQEQVYQKAISGKKGKIIRIPGRLLSAGDAFYKTIAIRGALSEIYGREGRAKGYKGKNLQRYIEAGLARPSDRHYQAAMREANYLTFTNKLGTFGSSLQRMANQFKPLRIIFPFIRTPTNIVKFAAERTPVGLMMQEPRNNLMGRNGKHAQDMQIARMAVGTSVMGVVAMLAAEGMITGGGPSDPKERRLKFQTGWQPYAIKIGDTYYAYGRLEPLGMLLGIAADLAEISHVAISDGLEEVGALAVAAISKNITSKTYLRGLSDLINAMTDPDRYGERWINSLLSTVVPTLSAQIARTNDPTLRQARSLLDTIKSRIPGQRETLAPSVDLYGRPIVKEGGVGPDIISPIYTSTAQNDPVAAELLRLKYHGGWAGKQILKVDLTETERNEYQRLMGDTARRILQPLIQSEKWSRYSDDTKFEIVDRVFDRARRAAKAQMTRLMIRSRAG